MLVLKTAFLSDLRKLVRLARLSQYLIQKSPVGKIVGLGLGYFLMTLGILHLRSVLDNVVGSNVTGMIAASLNFSYIFGGILYAERLLSKDQTSFWKKKIVIVVLVLGALYVFPIILSAYIGS